MDATVPAAEMSNAHLHAGMDGYLRPGCVHVTLQGTVDESTHLASLAGGIEAVLKVLIQGALAALLSECSGFCALLIANWMEGFISCGA